MFSGERLDGVLTTEQAIGKYALDIRGLRECHNLHQEAYIFYEGATLDSYAIRVTDVDNFDEQSLKIAESGHHCDRISKNVICSLDLKSTKLSQLEEKADETIYVPFDANTFSFFTDEMTDNSYNIYTSRYYPAYLSKNIYLSFIIEKYFDIYQKWNGCSFNEAIFYIINARKRPNSKVLRNISISCAVTIMQHIYFFQRYNNIFVISYHITKKISGLKKGTIKIPQINGMSFKYPPSPVLSQPENIFERSVCSLDKRSSECADTPLFCECLQLLQVPSRKTIEIILINEGNCDEWTYLLDSRHFVACRHFNWRMKDHAIHSFKLSAYLLIKL